MDIDIDPILDPIFLFYGLVDNEEFVEEIVKKKKDALSEINTIDLSNTKELIRKRKVLYNSDYPDLGEIRGNLSSLRDQLFMDSYMDDAKSFYLMLAFAASHEESSYAIIEKEVELFWKRYNYIYLYKNRLAGTSSIPPAIQQIEQKLFSGEIRRPSDHLYDDEKSIPKKIQSMFKNKLRVKWYWVSPLVFKWENCQIYNGWVIVDSVDKSQDLTKVYEGIITHTYKSICLSYVEFFKMQLTEEEKSQYKMFAVFNLDEIVDVSTFTSSIVEIDEILQRSPMCIVQMFNIMNSIGLDGYWRTVQMSFYLKQFIGENELIDFFWKHDSRNRVYATAESFKDGNQVIAKWIHQAYTAKNYRPMGCKSARAKGYCFYEINNASYVEKVLRDKYEEHTNLPKHIFESLLNDVKKAVNKQKYWVACALEMCLRLDMSEADTRKLYAKKFFMVHHGFYDYYAFMEKNYKEKEVIESEDEEDSKDEKEKEKESEESFE